MKKNKYKLWIGISILVMGIVVVIGYRMFIHKIPQVCTDKVCFSVELARTTQEHEQGLMYRTELAPHEGMLFIFDSPGIYSFWMKNTLIPLDIIWLDDQKYIKDIQTGVPCTTATCTVYTPKHPSQYVVEIPAGSAKTYKLEEGMMMTFKNI